MTRSTVRRNLSRKWRRRTHPRRGMTGPKLDGSLLMADYRATVIRYLRILLAEHPESTSGYAAAITAMGEQP